MELADQQVTGEEWGWFGGIIDGEGHMSVQKVNTASQKTRGYCLSARLSVTNTDPAIIVSCADILRRINVGYYVFEVSQKSGGKRTCFTLRVDRMSHLNILLPLLIPHLRGERQARSKLVLEFVQSRLRNGTNRLGRAHQNVPYTARDIEIGEILCSWNPNDYTLSLDDMRKQCLGRYSLDSERKPESAAEMTAPSAA